MANGTRSRRGVGVVERGLNEERTEKGSTGVVDFDLPGTIASFWLHPANFQVSFTGPSRSQDTKSQCSTLSGQLLGQTSCSCGLLALSMSWGAMDRSRPCIVRAAGSRL